MNIPLTPEQQAEYEKYRHLYQKGKPYGTHDHSFPHRDYVHALGAKSIADIGCGSGTFITWAANLGYHPAIGVDWAATVDALGVQYLQRPAWDTGLPDKHVDLVSGFDVLEHLRPEDVNPTLTELRRISRMGGVFTIAFVRSGARGPNNSELHACIRPPGWWEYQLSKYGTVVHTAPGGFFHVEW